MNTITLCAPFNLIINVGMLRRTPCSDGHIMCVFLVMVLSL